MKTSYWSINCYPAARDVQMFRNALILFHSSYAVIHSDKEHTFENRSKLANFLKTNANAIRQNRFYLISDSSTLFSRIIDAIDLFRTTGIDNYKVVNYQQYFAGAKPVAIQTPSKVESTIISVADSTYLIIAIQENSIRIKLLNDEIAVANASGLDEFFTTHKSTMSAGKILIISSKDLSYKKLEPVIAVLRKHKFHKYNLSSQD